MMVGVGAQVAVQQPLANEGFVVRSEEDVEDGEVPSLELLDRCWRLASGVDSPRDEDEVASAFLEAWRICRPEALRVTLAEAEAAEMLSAANSTFGPLMQSFIDRLEKGGEAIGWSFKANAEDGRPFRVERPLANTAKILRWRAVHPSGLGGMFTSGLGLIEKCAERGQALIIDWSCRGLLYCGHGTRGDAWGEFFSQPAAALLSAEEIAEALRCGDVTDFHGTPCMSTPKVGLPAWHAAKGRLLCQRFAWMRPELWKVAHDFADAYLTGATASSSGRSLPEGGCRWLAIHLRRSDKGDESPENLELSEAEISNQAIATASAWGCGGVYLASDDWEFKLRVQSLLQDRGLRVVTYGAMLSPDVRKCTHMDLTLDKHRKTWDACFEVAVMASCYGLLCTHSFMANMAIYYSRAPYHYRSFWDAPALHLDTPDKSRAPWETVD